MLGTLFFAYKWVRQIARHQIDEAFSNAADVVRWERALGMFFELDVQRWALRSRMLVAFVNRYYSGVHFPVSVAFLAWAYLWRPHGYPHLRRILLIVTGLGLVAHVAYPLAPPRMLGHLGFVDTLAVYGPSIYTRDTLRSAANQYAAMPSLHFGWALLVAYGVCRFTRARWRWLIVAHPLFTLVAIVSTANHYWLDAAAAALLVMAAVGLGAVGLGAVGLGAVGLDAAGMKRRIVRASISRVRRLVSLNGARDSG